ncbi:arginine deiminase [Boudabousia marimammalium]|uniref:Arginine deiminase n=1 Tax=Boudabousia marimammalium TaxID=156892 RepID=A0A1Q5PLY0_9ACTO|nr:arginine deiminase [Boudabousia marimammalium]OKL48062.1 hypothetical protein BM477_06235 [Boudabousia marimammalium]
MQKTVASEIGKLKTVMLHRPGAEFTRLSPSNKEHLLFDDVIWLSRAQEEHDRFAQIMQESGVEVLWVDKLLAEALENPAARQFALDNSLNSMHVDPRVSSTLHDHAGELSAAELGERLIAGVTIEEYEQIVGENLPDDLETLGGMVLPCLPNHLFTRDGSAWAYGGVSLNQMRMVARRRETVNLETIYSYHPYFQSFDFLRWDDEAGFDPEAFESDEFALEGGDVCVLGNRSLLIGVSERTTMRAVRRLAEKMLDSGRVDRIVAAQLPISRAFMHLDTVMTMVDEDTFVAYQGLGQVPTVTLSRGANHKLVEQHDEGPGMYDAIAKALGLASIRVLENPGDSLTAERDQWNDACNLLALKPGTVFAYDRNERANDFLREQGIKVVEVPGGELGRGRGGPRCMSCPIDRAPAS